MNRQEMGYVVRDILKLMVLKGMNKEQFYNDFLASGQTKTEYVLSILNAQAPAWKDDFKSSLNALFFHASGNEQCSYAYALAAGYLDPGKQWYAFDPQIFHNDYEASYDANYEDAE